MKVYELKNFRVLSRAEIIARAEHEIVHGPIPEVTTWALEPEARDKMTFTDIKLQRK